MTEKTLFRFGAVAAIVAAIAGVIGNLLHPRVTDFGEGYTESLLTEISESDSWITIHVVLLFVVVLAAIGLVAVARSITGASGLERLAFAVAIGGGAIGAVTIGIDGYGAKAVADMWAEAGSDQAAAFFAAQAFSHIGWGLFMLLVVTLFGAGPLIFGWAILAGAGYPKWTGWLGILVGAGSLIAGLIGIYNGPSATFFGLYLPFSILTTLWLLALGVYLWQKVGSRTTAGV